MSLTRAEKAASGTFGKAEQWFVHTPMAGMPAAPDTSSLSSQELAQFNTWLTKRTAGTITSPADMANMLANAFAMTQTYEAYFSSSNYLAWASQDKIGREAQWRLAHVDAIGTYDGSGTVPVALDPSGAGSNPPGAIATTPPAIAACTSAGNWTASAATGTITATAQAITVPTGNSGKLKLNSTKVGAGQMGYQIASGSWTVFTSGTIITLTTGQTLNFRMTGALSGSTMSGSIIDNDSGQIVATVNIFSTA